MIDCFFDDAFGVLSGPFLSTVLQCDARQHMHLKQLDSVVMVPVFYWGCVRV